MTHFPHPQHANTDNHPTRRTRRLLRGGALVAAVALAVAGGALAYYLSSGSGSGRASVGIIAPPSNVVAKANNGSASSGPSPLTITWDAPGSGATPTGYRVVRDDGSTKVTVSCNSSPCTDTGVPDGTYTYRVSSLLGTSWTSAVADSNALTVVNDSTPPTTALSLVSASHAYLAGSGPYTVYYKGDTSGSFRIADQITDSDSGPASAIFPGVSASGWTGHTTPEFVTSGSGSPPTITYTSSGAQLYQWSASPSNPPTATVTARDVAGNATGDTVSFISDTAGPTGGALTVNGVAATGGGSSSYSKTTSFVINSRTDYTDSGSGIASSVLTVQSFTLSNNSCGAAAGPFSSPTLVSGSTEPAGITGGYCYLYTLTGTDNIGNNSTIATTVLDDTAAPSVSVTFPADNGTYNAGGWTSGASIAGTATDATTGIGGASSILVTITQSSSGKTWNGSSFASGANSVPATTYNSGTGTWTLAFPNSNFPADGAYTVSAAATDRATNTGASSTNGFSYDATAPAVTLTKVNGATQAFPYSSNANVTTVGGACGSLAGDSTTINVTITGTTSQSGTATCSGNTWTYTMSPALSTEGSYTLTASQADSAGNTGSSGGKSITIDKTPPAVSLTKVNGATQAFPSYTNGTVTTIGGACGTLSGDSATVNWSVAGGATESGSTSCSAGAWTATLTTALSTAANYSVSATQSDAAGNNGSSGNQSIVIDKTAPSVAFTAPSGTSVTQPITYSGTAGAQVADSTHSADSTTVTVYVCSGTQTSCGAGGPSFAQALTATESGGNWSVVAGSLASGTYTAQAQQFDAAGNTATSPVDTFTTVTNLTSTGAGSYTLTVAPHITSFGFTFKGAGGGGGGNTGNAGAAGGLVSGAITIPDSATPTQFTVVVGGGGGSGSNNHGGTGGPGCAAGGAGGGGSASANGGGGGGGATCIYLKGSPAGTIVAVGGGGGGAGGSGTNGAGGIGGGGPSTNPGSNCGPACKGGNGGGTQTGGDGGTTTTSGSFPFTILNAGGAAGTGGGAGSGGTCGGGTCGAGGAGGDGGSNGNAGGGGGGGYASGGGGGGGASNPGGGGGGGSSYTGGVQASGNYTVSVDSAHTSNGGGSAGGGQKAAGAAGSFTFTGPGLSDPPDDPPDTTSTPPPPTTTDTTTTESTTTDTTTTDTTTTDATTTEATDTTSTTTTDTTTTDTTPTDATSTDTTPTDTPTDTTTTTGAPSPTGATAGLSTGREVLFFAVLGGSVLGVAALLTMPIPRRRRTRRRRLG